MLAASCMEWNMVIDSRRGRLFLLDLCLGFAGGGTLWF